jgi:uncharacterized protein YceK
MRKVIVLIALIFMLSGCGSTSPCSDADPTSACATSHGQVHCA